MNKMQNINTIREYLMIYLNPRELNQKNNITTKKGSIVKQIIYLVMNSRCQIDLIDMQTQPDGNYRFILVLLLIFI